jgi:hypothetical protein
MEDQSSTVRVLLVVQAILIGIIAALLAGILAVAAGIAVATAIATGGGALLVAIPVVLGIQKAIAD